MESFSCYFSGNSTFSLLSHSSVETVTGESHHIWLCLCKWFQYWKWYQMSSKILQFAYMWKEVLSLSLPNWKNISLELLALLLSKCRYYFLNKRIKCCKMRRSFVSRDRKEQLCLGNICSTHLLHKLHDNKLNFCIIPAYVYLYNL